MKHNEFIFDAVVWIYEGQGPWHFVTIPQDISDEIRNGFGNLKRRWGSIPVEAKINKTEWKTSIFPEKKENAYILPIKKEIRIQNNLHAGVRVRIRISIKV